MPIAGVDKPRGRRAQEHGMMLRLRVSRFLLRKALLWICINMYLFIYIERFCKINIKIEQYINLIH